MKILISHIDLDGFGVNVIEKLFHKELGFDKIFNLNYGFENDPNILPYLKEDNEIVIADLSIPESIYVEWKNTLKSLKVIDHHATTEFLTKYEGNLWTVERSGTWLFWNEYVKSLLSVNNPNIDYFVDLVDCYDRWQEDSPLWLSATRLNKVNNGLGSKFVDHILKKLKNSWEWTPDEEAIYKKIEIEEDRILEEVESNLEIRKDNLGYKFAVLEIVDKAKLSMVCSKLLHKYPEIDYVISCQLNKSKMSFRTRKDIDLTQLHGVNGHKQAAGAVLTRNVYWQLIMPDYCLKWVSKGTRKAANVIVEDCL